MGETVIRRIRIERGFDVPALCRLANIHLPEGYRADAGRTKLGPRLRRRLGEALGVPEDVIFDAAGWPRFAEGATMPDGAE